MSDAKPGRKATAADRLEATLAPALNVLRQAAVNIGSDHSRLEEAIEENDTRHAAFMQALADAVGPAIPALATGREVILGRVAGAVTDSQHPVVELGRGKRTGAIFYLCRLGERACFASKSDAGGFLTLGSPPAPRDLAPLAVVNCLADRVRGAAKGGLARRTVEVRARTERLRALEVLLGALKI